MKKVGRKIIVLMALILFVTGTNADAKSIVKTVSVKPIVLETNAESSFSQRIIDETNEKILISESEKTSSLIENQGGFVKAPADEIFEEKQEETTFLGALKQTVRDVYELEIERTDVPIPLLKDKLTHNFEKGPLESIHLWSGYQMHFTNSLPERGHNTSNFDMAVINVVFDSKFKGGKEGFRVMLEPSHHKNNHFMQTLFQDLYFESNRIPHTNIAVGHFRPGVGIEGASSAYVLDFINRSQIARNLSNARKMGLKVSGNYSLLDYNTGIYSSGTQFSDFFPGHEVDAWVNLKPLGKTNGKYGKLITGSGVQSGEKHGMSYYMTGAYAGYEYKKFKTKFEYARANGSNGGSGLTNARSQGFYWTTAYRITPKVELIGRYDQFDANRYVRNNNNREYTAGVNYYIKGQGLRLIFNYVYGQNDSKSDTHRLMVGTQILL